MPEGEFQVVPFKNPSGKTVYRVTGRMRGRRIRQNYPTREQAMAAKQRLEIEHANLPNLPMRQTRLTDAQLREAEQVFDRLSGQSLTEAVEFYLENYREPVEPIEVGRAVEAFLESKRHENRRPATLKNLGQRLRAFAAVYPGKLTHEILAGDVQAYVTRSGITPQTSHNDRLALSNFFRWAARHGYVAESPMEKVGRVKVDREEPAILGLDDCRRLMATATGFRDGVLVPYVALSLFAAIRPTELRRLGWSDVDLEGATISIGARIAKMRQRRLVSMSENLVDWIAPHHGQSPIMPPNWRRMFDALRDQAALSAWDSDIMRHTAISHHLAKSQHEGETAAWAGNSPTVIQQHYKGLVRPKDAEAFWKIGPAKEENVIPLTGGR